MSITSHRDVAVMEIKDKRFISHFYAYTFYARDQSFNAAVKISKMKFKLNV